MVLPTGDNIFSYFLTRIARRLPMLLLALGGIVFAIMRWKLHPRASLMTVVALGIYLVDMVVYTLILYWLPSIVEPMRMSTSASRFFYSVVYFIEDIVMAVTIILLVAAAFANRKVKTKFEEHLVDENKGVRTTNMKIMNLGRVVFCILVCAVCASAQSNRSVYTNLGREKLPDDQS